MKRLLFDSIMSKFAVVVDNALIDKYVNDGLYESVEKDIIDYFNNNYAYGMICTDKRTIKSECRLVESFGRISKSDKILSECVDTLAKRILDFALVDDVSLYDTSIFGISLQPLRFKEFGINVNNKWLDDFNVYVNIDYSNASEALLLNNNSQYKYIIKNDKRMINEVPTIFDGNKNRIKKASCVIVIRHTYCLNVEWIRGAIIHELKHQFDMFIRNIDNEELNIEEYTINKWRTEGSIYNQSFRAQQILNALCSPLQDERNSKRIISRMNADDMVQFIVNGDVMYLTNESEMTARLENFSNSINGRELYLGRYGLFDDEDATDIIKHGCSKKYAKRKYNIDIEEYSYNDICMRNVRYFEYARLMNALKYIKKYFPHKDEFTEKYYDMFSELYSKMFRKKNIIRDTFFDDLMQFYINRCSYFIRNALSIVIETMDEYRNSLK